MQSDDIARIAAGLTEAGREAVSCADPQKVKSSGYCTTLLIGRGLAEYRRVNTFWNAFCLTPLGLAVRDHLLKSDAKEDRP